MIILGILCPAYLFMETLFIHYIDAILNGVLTFDMIKIKAPEFVGHSKSGCQIKCFKYPFHILMFHHFITSCEFK